MPFLVRKIDRAKWMQKDILSGADVSADAITNCMKTKGNALSAWEITTEDQVNEVILAMGAQFDNIETVDVVILKQTMLAEAGLQLQKTMGATPLSDLADSHRDIVDLTYKSLGILARIIVDSIRDNKIRRYTKGDIKKIVADAIGKGRLDREAVRDKKLKVC